MPRAVRLIWLAVLLGHGAAAVVWWWVLPKGFPVAHLRFWAGQVGPWVLASLAAAASWGIQRRNPSLLLAATAALPAFWIALAITARVVFPSTARGIWLGPFLAGAALLAPLIWKPMRRRWSGSVLAAGVGIGLGILEVLAQRAPNPATRPLNAVLELPPLQASSAAPRQVPFPGGWVDLASAEVDCRRGNVDLTISPLLTFQSRSPDGCWTLLARRRDRIGPARRLMGWSLAGAAVAVEYQSDGVDRLRVTGASDILVEATSQLPNPVYSHLNSFCHIRVRGHRSLSLSFSPVPGVPVPVEPSDYPVGRPVHCAYLGRDRRLHVVRASSAEKGPFHELGQGPLSAGESLTLSLYDEDRAVCAVALDDFAAQADVSNLSPTAGWGLPPNAIEFGLVGDASSSEADIFVTLAGTSMGRGFDSVGHAPGTYRNRVRITAPAGE